MSKKNGIGSHQSSRMRSDEWLTPPYIIEELGGFDLDPCSPEVRPWKTANLHLTKEDDGLSSEWFGRVWCNPPYGKAAAAWLKKMSEHQNGIALIFARTETQMFSQYVWGAATGVLFIEGRLHFHYPDGTRAAANAGAPSCLVAYGSENATRLSRCGIPGCFIDLK